MTYFDLKQEGQAAGRARPVCERNSRAALSYRDEAAGEDRRGAVSDCRWRCPRSPALPEGMGGALPHRPAVSDTHNKILLVLTFA
jgi:hypothetical protein